MSLFGFRNFCCFLLIWIGLIIGSLSAQSFTSQEKFSIEDVLSAQMPSALIASTDQPMLAWIQDNRGARNIWIATGPDYIGRQVTSYMEDDGQELGSLAILPDGSGVVFVHGGSANRQGEIPNPLSDSDGHKQEIMHVNIADGVVTKLAEGSSPAVAPNGRDIAYIRKGQIWHTTMAADSRQMFTIRGNAGSLKWSPDGTKLAYESSRGDHGYIGIYSISDKKVTYIDPSVDRDRYAVWSPDGTQIAFMRFPHITAVLPFVERREALPWSISVYDIKSKIARTIFRADKGVGSILRTISASNQLFWGDGGWLVFPWEKTGWTQLYSVSAKGGEAKLLSTGDGEVQFASLSPDKKEVLYDSNVGDIDRKHLWRVAVSGGKAKHVTKGKGVEWSPVLTTDKKLALIRSAGTLPAHTAIFDGNDFRQLSKEAIPKTFPAKELVEPQQVIFSAADGMKIHGQFFVPKDIKKGERRPAAIFFHGGSRRQMLLGFHHRGYYHNAYAFNQYLVSRGYIVLAVNYRSGIGYGMEFREALNYGAHGASEYNDVIGAGLFLQGRNDVDPESIGLWGGSYGGYLTALGLAQASDMFAAGVDLHGVHDWTKLRNFGTYSGEAARIAFESSPMAFVDGWKSPVLLIHGDDDRNVPFSETVDLAEALRNRNVYFEQLIFPDEVHGFLLYKNWVSAYKAAADFFDRKLSKH